MLMEMFWTLPFLTSEWNLLDLKIQEWENQRPLKIVSVLSVTLVFLAR